MSLSFQVVSVWRIALKRLFLFSMVPAHWKAVVGSEEEAEDGLGSPSCWTRMICRVCLSGFDFDFDFDFDFGFGFGFGFGAGRRNQVQG